MVQSPFNDHTVGVPSCVSRAPDDMDVKATKEAWKNLVLIKISNHSKVAMSSILTINHALYTCNTSIFQQVMINIAV